MKGKKTFSSSRAPEAQGPYSQAVIHNGLLYISGQIPIDPVSGLLVRATIEEETESVLNNIRGIVEDAGARMEDVLKVACYLADMNDFERFNAVYEKYFPENPPARTSFQVARLPLDVHIEIDAITALPG